MNVVAGMVRPADELAELAGKINAAHAAGEDLAARGLAQFRQAGEMLLRAKARCGHGHWLAWLRANVSFSRQTAENYMRLAKLPVTGNLAEGWREISNSAVEREINWADKQCETVEWYTPPHILAAVRDYFGGPIPLDSATAPTNPTAATRFYTLVENGLEQPWDSPVYVNPPYGKVLPEWCVKIHQEAGEGREILALLPAGARFSTGYWQEHILTAKLAALCFLRGRVAFLDAAGRPQSGNTYDSILYGYNVDCGRFAAALAQLGKVVTVTICGKATGE